MTQWSRTPCAALGVGPVVVIGPDAVFTRTLAREVESLPGRVRRAGDLEDAIARADRRSPPQVILVPEPSIDVDAFEEQIARLRIRSGARQLVPITYGRAPAEVRRRALRGVGVALALFGSFGRNALRFQINRALAASVRTLPRGRLRAPQEWRARSFASGRAKAVCCYSLSPAGAYLVTPRPWVVGSDVDLELPVGRERLLVSGRIVYTNLGDGTDRQGLPRGMAVSFRPLSEHVQQLIREGVSTAHERLEV